MAADRSLVSPWHASSLRFAPAPRSGESVSRCDFPDAFETVLVSAARHSVRTAKHRESDLGEADVMRMTGCAPITTKGRIPGLLSPAQEIAVTIAISICGGGPGDAGSRRNRPHAIGHGNERGGLTASPLAELEPSRSFERS